LTRARFIGSGNVAGRQPLGASFSRAFILCLRAVLARKTM
jgi:hypothetical protein